MLKRLGDLLMGTGRKKSSLDGLEIANQLNSIMQEIWKMDFRHSKDIQEVKQIFQSTKLDLARLTENLLDTTTRLEEASRKPQKHGTSSKSNASTKKPLKNSKSSKAKTKKQP